MSELSLKLFQLFTALVAFWYRHFVLLVGVRLRVP